MKLIILKVAILFLESTVGVVPYITKGKNVYWAILKHLKPLQQFVKWLNRKKRKVVLMNGMRIYTLTKLRFLKDLEKKRVTNIVTRFYIINL